MSEIRAHSSWDGRPLHTAGQTPTVLVLVGILRDLADNDNE
ncbi:hypothetical protein AB0E10_43010 [Streptomyces sp. NPDC048045]